MIRISSNRPCKALARASSLSGFCNTHCRLLLFLLAAITMEGRVAMFMFRIASEACKNRLDGRREGWVASGRCVVVILVGGLLFFSFNKSFFSFNKC